MGYDFVNFQGSPFQYFTYGASVSEVRLDVLSGETHVCKVDILQDVGRSINPALDIAQIEGGFVQGMGWLTTEELVWKSQGAQRGRLMTQAPQTYKIPTARDVPEVFNVALFDNVNAQDGVDINVNGSKAVGEPPFMLANSVFLAIRDAVSACLPANELIKLNAPATPEAVLKALQP